jgi:hypothetical protein
MEFSRLMGYVEKNVGWIRRSRNPPNIISRENQKHGMFDLVDYACA